MTWISAVSVVALLSYAFLLVLVRGQAYRREVRYFALFLVAMMVWQLGATAATFTSDPNVALWCYRVVIGVGSLFCLFYALFVTEFLRIRRSRRLFTFGYIYFFISSIYVLTGGPFVTEGIQKARETGLLVPEFGLFTYFHALVIYGFLGYSGILLIQAYRRTPASAARTSISYLLVGLIFFFAGSFANLDEGLRGYPFEMVGSALNAALIAVAILRHDLFDISRTVRKGLAYVLPTGIITTFYFGIIFVLVDLLHPEERPQAFVITLFVATGLALALEPLRGLIQTRLDRYFFREKYNMGQMLQRLSKTVASVLDLKILASSLLTEITSTVHVEKAALLLKDKQDESYRLFDQLGYSDAVSLQLLADNPIPMWVSKNGSCLARYDLIVEPGFKGLWWEERASLDEMEMELIIPLLVGGDLVGMILLGPKRSQALYSPEEQSFLLTLANQTAVAVQNAWLYQAAIEEKEQTETVLQSAFSGIMVIAPDMRILAMNNGAQTITGFRAEELIGKSLNSFFGADLWGTDSALSRSVQTGLPQPPQEIRIAVKEGLRDILLGVTPVRDGYLLNFADITQLKDVDRLKSNIVSNVSHELRTPLASIKAYTELLLGGFAAEDEHLRTDFLSVIDSEADRLAEFIDDLLDLSRLQSGSIGWQAKPLDFGTLLQSIIDSLTVQAIKAGVMIRTDFAKKMPLLTANGEILKSMARNLISNAIKYSTKGGVVSVRTRVVEECVVLEVVDEGIGIPADDLPYLFTRFYRSWSAREAGVRGTGLGLALVKEAVELHHGTISVESQVNVGTHFTVTLPISNNIQPISIPVGSANKEVIINEMV